MIRRIGLIVCLLVVPLAAQESAPPVLSPLDALTLKASLQQVLITQLQLQMAQDANTRAQQEAQALLKRLQQPGFTLDIRDLDHPMYVPTPAGAPKEQPHDR